MQRLIWLAIFCLAGIGGLFAVRSAMGVGAIGRAAPEAVAADVKDADAKDADVEDLATPPLAKGDRLPSRFFDSALPKTAVETVKIVPTEPPKPSTEPPKPAEASKDDVVSWHWHEGSKIVRHRRAQ